MKLFNNETPYTGKIKLKIEKGGSYYSTGSSVLNKYYFKVFGYYVSSRMYPNKDADGDFIITAENKILIESTTGGYLSDVYNSIKHKGFTTHKGDYVGDAKDAWWYYKNNLKVDDEYPGRVAQKWNKELLECIGYYGYTHRGGQLFVIGDKIFEKNYLPVEEHFEEWQWAGWLQELEKSEHSNNIIDVIPFKLRGSKTIENLKEAKEAARNISDYLS